MITGKNPNTIGKNRKTNGNKKNDFGKKGEQTSENIF